MTAVLTSDTTNAISSDINGDLTPPPSQELVTSGAGVSAVKQSRSRLAMLIRRTYT